MDKSDQSAGDNASDDATSAADCGILLSFTKHGRPALVADLRNTTTGKDSII